MTEILTYSPSSLVNIFNNALVTDASRKLFRIKGIYVQGKGMNYSGVYYDSIKDEYSEASVTLVVPALLRNSLVPQQTIECSAYLTKKVQVIGAKIELQVNVTEVHSQEQSKITDDQIKALELLQMKASQGYRDVDSFIKIRIIQQVPVKVTIIIGRTGIIDSDIKHDLESALGFFDFNFVRVSLTSESEIISALEEYDEESGILVLSRGGGDNMPIFNKPSLAEAALKLESYFVTAIGHKEDTSLLQKVADKAFITPTALGQYFKDIYNDTVYEIQNSKAQLVEDITTQLKSTYEERITNLDQQIKSIEAVSGKHLAIKQEQIDLLEKRLATKGKIIATTWLLVLIALILGLLIGMILL